MRTGVHGQTDNDLGGNVRKGMKRTRNKFHPFAGAAFGMLCIDPPPPDPTDPPSGGAPAKTFTQDDLTRIATAEAAKGKRAGAAEVAAELGMTVAEAVALIAASKAAEEAVKTEAQKATDAAAAAKVTADAQTATAAQVVLASKVLRGLLIAGIAPLGADGKDNPQLALAVRLVDVAADADDAAITAAITAVKTQAPSFFAPPVAKGDGVPGTPGPQTRAAGTTFGSAGAAEAAKRYPPPKVA